MRYQLFNALLLTCNTFCKADVDAVTQRILIGAQEIKDHTKLCDKLNVFTAIHIFNEFMNLFSKFDKYYFKTLKDIYSKACPERQKKMAETLDLELLMKEMEDLIN